jgi:AcrR family transcriptional regulator
MIDTKQKILDTAERLFAEQGYGATSMRQIIAEAGVNLAAIHYHFGSKEELLDGIIFRKAGPVNERRMALLDKVITEAGDQPPQLEALLHAFLNPVAKGADKSDQFVKFMGRLFSEGLFPEVVRKHFQDVMKRFLAAFRAAVPDLPEDEFLWRFHFMVGALSHTMCEGKPVSDILGLTHSFEDRLERLARFVAAGFRAPADTPSILEVNQ